MKKILSVLLALAMLIATIPTAIAQGFTDVKEGEWYSDAVDYVVSNGLMSGYNASTFGTNDALSRAMVMQILYNKEGQPVPPGKHEFNDVTAGDWFNNAVSWGTQKGVMSGYGGGRFAPNDNVTLEQIAVILWNYSGNPSFVGSADAVGVHSNWAENGLAWAVGNNIFTNVPFISVTAAATRAQTAQILTNYLTGKASGPVVTGITLDITEHKMGEDWTQYLTATLAPAGIEDTVTWSSSNPRVATVDQRGKVSGVAGGETIITARTSNGLTATCKVEVWHSHKLIGVRESSCLTSGVEVYACACGHSYSKYLPAVGGEHRWFTDYCTRCGISPCDYSQVTHFTDTGYEEYDRLIAEYAFALSLGNSDFRYNSQYGFYESAAEVFIETCERAHGKVGFEDFDFVLDELNYGDANCFYALYDIDANGTHELLLSNVVPVDREPWGSDLVVYGVNAAGAAVYIGSGVYRGGLAVLSGGRILEYGNYSAFCNSYSLYQLTENGKKKLIESCVCDERGPEEVSYFVEKGYEYITLKEWDRRFEALLKASVLPDMNWISFE